MLKFIIILALVPSTVFAANNTSFEVMPEYACKQDAVRFCKHTLDGASPFTILACLSAHKKQLSKECRGILTKYGQ